MSVIKYRKSNRNPPVYSTMTSGEDMHICLILFFNSYLLAKSLSKDIVTLTCTILSVQYQTHVRYTESHITFPHSVCTWIYAVRHSPPFYLLLVYICIHDQDFGGQRQWKERMGAEGGGHYSHLQWEGECTPQSAIFQTLQQCCSGEPPVHLDPIK